jgi:hypothetical protein
MESTSPVWRVHPFIRGGTFIAHASFLGFPHGDFVAGRHYVFDGAAYNRGESSTIFTFHEAGSSAPMYWWWHDDEPDALCKQRFRVSEGIDTRATIHAPDKLL